MYVEFKRIKNIDLGLVVTGYELRCRAEERTDIIQVEGRSGSIVDRYGTFASYKKTIEFANLRPENFSRVNKWLSGRGKLRTSADPNGFYYADVVDVLTREQIGECYHYIKVDFLVEPFFYLDSGTLKSKYEAPVTLYNVGSIASDPVITVHGNGDGNIYVNQQVIKIKGMEERLTIDSRLMICHKDGLPAGRKMEGPYPMFSEGENKISWDGGVTMLEITPMWREL